MGERPRYFNSKAPQSEWYRRIKGVMQVDEREWIDSKGVLWLSLCKGLAPKSAMSIRHIWWHLKWNIHLIFLTNELIMSNQSRCLIINCTYTEMCAVQCQAHVAGGTPVEWSYAAAAAMPCIDVMDVMADRYDNSSWGAPLEGVQMATRLYHEEHPSKIGHRHHNTNNSQRKWEEGGGGAWFNLSAD